MELQNNHPLVMVAYLCPSSSQKSIAELFESARISVPEDDRRVAGQEPGKKYVYGLRGIQELFNVSHVTAQKYKDGILKDAVSQYGRKIVVDVEKALELFNSNGVR